MIEVALDRWKSALLTILCLSIPTGGQAQSAFRLSGAATLQASFIDPNSGSLLADQQPDTLGRAGVKFGVRNRDFLKGRFFGEFAAYGERSVGDDLVDDAESRVNELHMIYDFGNSSVVVGRKRTEWGTGLVSSPTNIISVAPSPIDPDDDFFRIEGRDVIQYTYTATDSSIDLLVVREEENSRFLNDLSVATRYYTNLEGVDLSFVGGLERDGEYVFGANLAFTVGQSLELHADVVYDSSAVRGGPLVENLGQIEIMRTDSASALAGGQWTPNRNWNVILEYLYFQDGLSNGTVEELVGNRTLPLRLAVAGGSGLLQTHYLFGRVSRDEVLPNALNVDLEYTLLQSLENAGGLHSVRATREIGGYGGVYAETAANVGNERTELGQFPASFALRLGVELEF